MATLDLHRLKTVVSRLLDEAIAENGSHQFTLDHNFYWTLDCSQEFNLDSPPTASLVGSLHDDWELTRELADSKERVTTYSLTEVAPPLAYIGNKQAKVPPLVGTEPPGGAEIA
jgi:hypothetical protein